VFSLDAKNQSGKRLTHAYRSVELNLKTTDLILTQGEIGQMSFIRVGESLLNLQRVLAVQHKPESVGGVMYSREHYAVAFDTGQELWLTPSDGMELLSHGAFRPGSRSDGMTATTSETAT